MRFWNFEIRWITPEKQVLVKPTEFPFPVVLGTPEPTKKKPTVKKATTRKVKDENKKPIRTTKARKVAKST